MAPVSVQLVYPLCAMFFLSFVVLIVMFLKRVKAIKSGVMKANYFKTYNSSEPCEDVIKVSRHFSNLFEAPVLFYLVCILGMILPAEGFLFLVLAWVYVAARVVHAIIHIGPNRLYYRMSAYAVGWAALTVMWILVFIKALSISAIS